jgi:hypothetical protein
MATNKKQTSQSVSSLASETLRDNNASKVAKQLAASALSQSNTVKQTGAQLENCASRVLQSEKYSDVTKTLAASVLSQSNKSR